MASRSVPATITPSVLKAAREVAGYPVSIISDKLKVSPQEIIEWEEGVKYPSLSKLRKISNYYKRPLAYFFLPKPPTEKNLPKDFRSLSRQEKYPLSPETKLLIRKARKYQTIATDLISVLGIKVLRLEQINITDNPENVSYTIRQKMDISIQEQIKWSTSSNAYNNWRNKLESKNILVLQFPIPLEEARGFTFLSSGVPTIVISSKDSLNGRIFSLIHEFSHLLLRNEGIYSFYDTYEKNEIFCNHFSGAFLVPERDFIELFNFDLKAFDSSDFDVYIEKMARNLSVSKYVILRRLEKLHLITNKKYQDKANAWEEKDKDKKSRNFGISSYPQRIISQKGLYYISLVLRANRMGLLNKADTLEYLDIKAKHLPELEMLVRE